MLELEKKTGVKNPRLRSRPTLRTGNEQYMLAYGQLSRSRGYTDSGLLPLAIADIKAYMDIIEVEPGHPRRRFLAFIQAMDEAHLAYISKKQKSKLSKAGRKK